MSAPEVIDIGGSMGGSDTITLNIGESSGGSKGMNFGAGLDMLMNEKHKSGATPTADIDIGDLNKLESELNDLSEDVGSSGAIKKGFSILPGRGSGDSGSSGDAPSGIKIEPISIDLNKGEGSTVGSASASGEKKQGTWDGFKKFNDIPVKPNEHVPKEAPMTKQERFAKKFEYLRKLEMLERKGVNLSKKYSMDSPLDEMRGEYEMIMSEKEKSNSVKFQGKIMMACVTALEYLNGKFDPFDFKLDGWGESIQENIDDYDEIFAELHEKYKSKAKMAPELKLLFQLGGSAVMLHMTNTMFKSAMPGMDDIMRQNPELMQQFTSAAVNSMSQNNPGFGNFMGNVMGGGGGAMPPRGSPPGPRQPDISRRPEIIPPGPSNRPDIGMSRGIPQFDDAADMEAPFASAVAPPKRSGGRRNKTPSAPRPDMKGPGDISDLLAGLKTKKIDIRQKEMMDKKPKGSGGSTISIDELMSIQKDADNVPRKTKRRPKSEKNTVSLDI